MVPNGHIFGFDIQDIAINNTKKLLDENNINNYTLFNCSHDLILEKLNVYKGKISFIVYNLGYLPNGNKDITTNYESTISSIKGSLKLLNKKGIIVITVYPGHDEGKIESEKIREFLKTIDNIYNINEYHNTDDDSSPYVIYIKTKEN